MELEYNLFPSAQFNHLNDSVYIIFDTNVLIQNLKEIKDIIQKNKLNRTDNTNMSLFFIVPWIVIMELDALKSNRKGKLLLEIESRAAIDYLLKIASENCDFITFQNSAQNEEISNQIKCVTNDDYILKCALKSKETCKL